MEPGKPRSPHARPRVAEGLQPESDCAFLTWSAEEVAEWVARLGFPQYEVRGCRSGRETPALGAACTGGLNSVCACERVRV